MKAACSILFTYPRALNWYLSSTVNLVIVTALLLTDALFTLLLAKNI